MTPIMPPPANGRARADGQAGRQRPGGFWNARKLARLRALAPTVRSAEIAKALGCTRNMVIGKAHREGVALMNRSAAMRAYYAAEPPAKRRARRRKCFTPARKRKVLAYWTRARRRARSQQKRAWWAVQRGEARP